MEVTGSPKAFTFSYGYLGLGIRLEVVADAKLIKIVDASRVTDSREHSLPCQKVILL